MTGVSSMHSFGEQLELPLFSPMSFDALIQKTGAKGLTVVLNNRLKRGWSVKINSFSAKRTLTIPRYFEDAPETIKTALIEWAHLPVSRRRKKTSPVFQRKKQLERAVWEYVEQSGNKADKVRLANPNTFSTQGRVYDLREVFDALNATYFSGKLSSYIRWNKSNWRSYQTFFVDKSKTRLSLISVAQTYNKIGVPRFAIEGIVYHEMLHIAIPPYKRGGKNVIHGPEFRKTERGFPHFNAWRRWEKEHLKSIND
jgi:hypothetical protein